ncbi:Mitochondrial import inner membrane translocase subunit tim44 [Purpureocillium lavendulum]|uniref:Mitochondrial import inner membrane translocase subunit tim44 n=1 Tax=Purpureocillium lavendulum TaxID=1247861 RepID=A0AB34G1U9_9HYPO|nr:Mitochondrial import inner membrane translocase subunit tim44 [Purpureocillium lavendulum]
MFSWVVILPVALWASSIIWQLLPKRRSEPPTVFHWFPFLGNAISYGMNPHSFFARCREQHGDIFTFVLLGKRITCYFGLEGNEFILNGKQHDLNAEEIYSPLTTPVFGSDVIYDCPNSKLMEQKKFVKFGLTQQALECHVPLIEREVLEYIKGAAAFKGENGAMDVSKTMSEITIFTAGRALQGDEVRAKLTAEFAALYHDLDMGFQPINFLVPWAPLPHNRKRDEAHSKMRDVYMEIIAGRRQRDAAQSSDMIWNLMNCKYKDGMAVPDKEIAHLMITLLMAGQHTSASASSWIMLRLAARPDIGEQLYQEQVANLGAGKDGHLEPLTYSDLAKLPLLSSVIRETLRVHSAIHSVMRKVTRPIAVPGTPFVVTPGMVLLASPSVTALSDEHFKNASEWDPHRWDSGPEAISGGGGGVDDDKDESMSKGTRSPYLPFGAGRHRCVGEKFAYLNLGVIVATLVRSFRFYTVDGKGTVPETDYSSLLSRPKEPAIVRWERRYGSGLEA